MATNSCMSLSENKRLIQQQGKRVQDGSVSSKLGHHRGKTCVTGMRTGEPDLTNDARLSLRCRLAHKRSRRISSAATIVCRRFALLLWARNRGRRLPAAVAEQWRPALLPKRHAIKSKLQHFLQGQMSRRQSAGAPPVRCSCQSRSA
jgi:hypothetical protein